jgi:hypothetical protein
VAGGKHRERPSRWDAAQKDRSCRRKPSAVLDCLMSSLELGMHQDDVVLPVHIYLPPIKAWLLSQLFVPFCFPCCSIIALHRLARMLNVSNAVVLKFESVAACVFSDVSAVEVVWSIAKVAAGWLEMRGRAPR